MATEYIAIKELVFGKTDAYNELLEYGPEHFARSFLPYDAYNIDSFINGSKYYIYGGKGTGKTALLKYLECTLSQNPENLVVSIRYKSSFDADDKKELIRASIPNNVSEEIIENVEPTDAKDCVLAWQLYLISRVINGIENDGEYQLFLKNRQYEDLIKLIKSVYADNTHHVVPKISKGHATINLSTLKGLSADVELEIELQSKTKQVNYQKLAKKVIELYTTLSPITTPHKIYILFDELELSVQSKKMNKRDIELVRDLILAVYKLNEVSKTKSFPIFFISSIRSEVINSIYSSGYEINKPIEDYGKEVSWYIRGGNYNDSPLIAMIIHKIKASEELAGIPDSGDIWKRYFPATINEYESKEYILRYTWHRPRDIVRLLGIAQEYSGNSSQFTQEIFDKTMRVYSEKSWNEIAEDLSLIYDKMELKTIKKLFTNISVPFTFGELNKRLNSLSEKYDYIAAFKEKHKLIDVLDQLFDSGVIGNSGQRMLFKFLKDGDLDPTGNMIIHQPLRNYFAVQSHLKT